MENEKNSDIQKKGAIELTNRVFTSLKNDYLIIGKHRVKGWHTWLIIGIGIGVIVGIVLVADRTGKFETGKAVISKQALVYQTSTQIFQPPSPITQCSVGARVQLNSDIDVFDDAKNIIGQQFAGARGVVALCSIEKGTIWWKINYDTGADGWSRKYFFIAPYNPLPLIVGDKEIIMTKVQRDAKRLNYWPDNTMGVVKESVSTYKIFTSNGSSVAKTGGTLDSPADSVTNTQIQNMKHNDYKYFAGGPVYKDTTTGMLIMVYHAEKNITDFQNFWSLLGMAKSTDGGTTWFDLGEIVIPNTPFTDKQGFDIGGGAFAIAGKYFYVYFRDLIKEGSGTYPYTINHLAVARAKVTDVISAAKQGNVVNWYKYYNENWNEPAIGGRSSSLEVTNPTSGFFSVSYNKYIQQYILVIDSKPFSNLHIAYSPDGLKWSARQIIEKEVGESSYPSIIGLGDEPINSNRNFYVYYNYSLKGGWNKWDDAILVRQKLALSTDFFSIQGYDNWYYLDSNDTPMIFNATENRWEGNELFLSIDKYGGHPGNAAAAQRQWIAPQAGTITITGKAYDRDITCGQGVQISIKQNSTIVWNVGIKNGNTVGYTFNLTRPVNAGDKIKFIIDKGTDNSILCDSTYFNPAIQFNE